MNENQQPRPVNRKPFDEENFGAGDEEFESNARSFREAVREAFGQLPADWRRAVDEDAENGYPDTDIVPSKGLTQEERIIEAHFALQVAQDPIATLEEYIALSTAYFGPEAEGRYLNGDLARDLYPLYREHINLRPVLERATVAPAGFTALNLAWKHWLRNTDAGERGTVVFSAGGMASGKTTAMNKAFPESSKRTNAIFLDSVLMNHKTAVQRIGEAEAAGLTPYLAFVYRPFESAASAAVKRLLEIGRPVGLDQLGPAHYDAQRTFFQLYQAFGNRINFDVILNEGGIDEISRTIGIESLKERAYFGLEWLEETTCTMDAGTRGETVGTAGMTPEERLAEHARGMAEWKAKHGDSPPKVH